MSVEEAWTVPTSREVVERALGIIEKHGWGQLDFINAAGEVCALGSVNAACIGYDLYRTVATDQMWTEATSDVFNERRRLTDPQRFAVTDALELALQRGGETWPAVSVWNDSRRRTKEDVVLLLKQALEILDEQERQSEEGA